MSQGLGFRACLLKAFWSTQKSDLSLCVNLVLGKGLCMRPWHTQEASHLCMNYIKNYTVTTPPSQGLHRALGTIKKAWIT